jgi:outer membrane protein TolC
MRAKTVRLALALAAAPVAAAAQDARRVTLAEALRLAAQTQPAMVQARQDLRVARAQERQALGAFLPTVNLSSSGTNASATRPDVTTGRPVQGTSSTSSATLSASLDLFTGFRRGAQRRSTEATGDLREATLLRQEFAVALQVKEAFFAALAAGELVGVAETRVQRADEQLKLARERLRLGSATRSDTLRARVEVGTAQLQLVQAGADLQNAGASLARLIGVDGVAQPVGDTALEARISSLDTSQLRREAAANAPAVREAEASAAAARASLSASRAAYFPTVSVSGNQTWQATDLPFQGLPYRPSWSLRLSFTYPLFNGFQRETNVTAADAAAVSAEARARDARLLLEANLTQAFAALEAAAQRIDIARVSLAAAEEDQRMQRERYRLGTATIVELLASQVSLDQAAVDLVRARYDYLVARAQLEAYVGRTL